MEAILAAAGRLAHVGGWAVDLGSREAQWTDELLRLHGFDPAGESPALAAILARIHPDDRRAIERLLKDVFERPEEVPAAGLSAEYRLEHPEHGTREIRFLGRVERAEDGRLRWLGSVQDVTEQRVNERELRVHYALAQALREWQSFDEGLVVLLRRLGTALEYSLGTLWVPGEDAGRLRCRAFWASPDVDSEAYEELVRSRALGPGEGAAGWTWRDGRPLVTADMSAAPWAVADAVSLGLRSVVAVPVAGEDGPLATLAFYSPERHEASDRIVAALSGVAEELGRFLSGRRGLLGDRTLSGRELEVLRLAAEGCSGPEIAERLTVSPSTVKSHFENIYEKLGVGDRASAVARALRTGLIR